MHPLFCDSLNSGAYIVSKELNLDPDSFVSREILPAPRHLLTLVHRSWISYSLKMEEIRTSETSVNKISTQRHISEDGILHSHLSEKPFLADFIVLTRHLLGGTDENHKEPSQDCRSARRDLIPYLMNTNLISGP
jgi:hypothetical protein